MLVRLASISLLLGLVLPAGAFAEPLPLTQTVRAGKPLRSLKVAVTTGDTTTVVANGKSHVLPAKAARSATVETVPLAGDAALTWVRVEAENGDWSLLLGGRAGTTALVSGRTDWVGDPGERRMLLIEAAPANEQGARSMRFGTRYEGLGACFAEAPLLEAKQIDPTTLEASPSESLPLARLSALESTQAALELAVHETPQTQALNGFDPAGSSRVEESTRFYLAPRAAVDGDAKTVWALSSKDFMSLRWTQPLLAIESLEIDVLLDAAPVTPTTLSVLADNNQVFRVDLAGKPVEKPAPYTLTARITPTAPLSTRCLALIAPELPAGKSLNIAEVRANTALDREGGINRQVSLLVQDGPEGAKAADLLAALGEPGALAVAARYDELSTRGKRRALRVLARGLAEPAAAQLVLRAAHDPDADLRAQALSVLKTGGEPGRVALRELALEASELGDTAAKALAQHRGEVPHLLAALAHEGGSERPGLRDALAATARREPESFAQAVDAWLPNASVVPQASLSLAVATANLAPLALRLSEPAWNAELGFPERYRFAHALASAAPSEQADSWLEQQANSAAEWMMRRAAFEALASREPGRAQALASSLATDAYPRVRAATFPVLLQSQGLSKVEELAQRDPWPLVRVEAARALSTLPEGRKTLEAMLADPASRVRAAAIDGLHDLSAFDAWPNIAQRLSAGREAPTVELAAIAFARGGCLQAAREWLVSVVRRTFRADADDQDARLGVDALAALHDLGGAAAADAKTLAGRAEAPPGLSKAYTGLRPPRCGAPAAPERP